MQILKDFYGAHAVFTDHMVLQRRKPIRISGTAPCGTVVHVSLNGQTVSGTADAQKEWCVEFPAMEAGGPYVMKVSDGNKTIEYQDILIGEVWMCSGQSNMEMPMYGGQPYWCTKNYEEEIRNANDPQLRFYASSWMRRLAPDGPLSEENGPGWTVCTSQTVEKFSACAYFFGRQLRKDLQVPVGLVDTSWGGTIIEAWYSRKKMEECQDRTLLNVLDKKQEAPKRIYNDELEVVEEWLKGFFDCGKSIAAEAENWKKPDFDDSAWQTFTPPLNIEQPSVQAIRGTIMIPPEAAGKDLILNIGAINDCDQTWFNGEKIGETDIHVLSYWNISRFYRVPGHLVKAGKNVLYIRAINHFGTGSWTGSGLHSPNNIQYVLAENPNDWMILEGSWRTREEFTADINRIGTRPPVNMPGGFSEGSPNYPATLFNAAIYPWLKYRFAGAIWYQGCSNNGQETYYKRHQMLIDDWREQWNQPDMPFILVQLAGYGNHCPDNRGDEDAWKHLPVEKLPPYALTREIQAEMRNVRKNVGMAVALDVGNQYDIHPRDKQSVGYRLAMEAERIVYGKNIVSEGPRFRCFKAEGNAARVFFDHIDGGLTTNDGAQPGAFALSADGKNFVWANARIDGDTVIVTAPEITTAPKAVRYGFVSYRGDVNLCNGAGFPAEPFRSDKPDWSTKKIDL